MTAVVTWGVGTLLATTALMLIVLAVRAPARHWVGPRIGYYLWLLPALRLAFPALSTKLLAASPTAGATAATMSVLFAGPRGSAGSAMDAGFSSISEALPLIWIVGALSLLTIHAVRHFAFCRRLCVTGTDVGQVGSIRIIATDVEGPLAFGVFRRFIAVPPTFARSYRAPERDLAIAHESAHHARGDLAANWASLVVLAVHWWNPIAWVAIKAFRDDQEFAADALVLAGREPSVRPLYAQVLAKAAGIGALPACNLSAHSNLKGRLMMLRQKPPPTRRLVFGGLVLTLLGGTALAATVTATGPVTGRQVVTIGVKPDGAGSYALIIAGTTVASGAPLPDGRILPADFSAAGGCDLTPMAKPFAMVTKGSGGTQTYTVMCGSATATPVRVTLTEGLVSLNTMRVSVATQAASPVFTESERAYALGAIDRSISEVEATLAATG